MAYTLKDAAPNLGLTRTTLIKRMRAKGLLDANNLPAFPLRDKLYLSKYEGRWAHEKLGLQYSYSTRVTDAGIRWLAEQLGIERPAPPPVADPREVA
jgi:hypothetical protein